MGDLCALAIEAATDRLGIAACRGTRRILWEARPARAESMRLYEHCGRVLAEAGAGVGDLHFVAFGCGPGAFTGVRLAAAAAQSIAFARSIPVCRLSTLAVLAVGAARESDANLVGVCLDARMGRAYIALYGIGADGDAVAESGDAIVDPRGFRLPGERPFAAVGDGWAAYPDLAARHGARIASLDAGRLPSAGDLLTMGIAAYRAGRTVTAAEALPEYLGHGPSLTPT